MRRRHARWFACLALALACLASSGNAAPSSAADPLWHTIPLPGGSEGLAAVLNLPGAVEPERVLPEAMRLAYDVPEGKSDRTAAWRAALLDYVSLLDEFERRVAAAGARDGLRLQPNAPKPVRKAQRELLEFVGFRVRERRDTIEVEPRRGKKQDARLAVLEAAGLALDDTEDRLNRGEPVTISVRTDAIPLPLSPRFWAREIIQSATNENRLFAAILSDPKLLFTYHGLLSLDPATLAYFRDNPDLIRRMRDDSPAAFAVFAGSLTIHDGRVIVPGGEEAADVWQRLVDAPPTNVERFVRRLFGRDEGRLAMYFDALAHLPDPQRRFALALYLPPGERRRETARQTWRAFDSANSLVRPSTRPFQRRSLATMLLAETAVERDGRPLRPANVRFWKAVFDSADLPDRPERITTDVPREGLIDAGWMLDRIHSADPSEQPARARLWLFGQRVFAGVEDRELPDAFVALRGFITHEALLLTLERMDIRRPATFAAAVRRANALSQVGDQRQRALLLGQFQSAVAIVEKLRTSRSVSAERADHLIASLAAVPTTDGRYRGALLAWLDSATEALAVDRAAPLESRIASLVSGESAEAAMHPASGALTWEGHDYRVDLAQPRRDLLLDIRQGQRAPTLDTAQTLARAARDLRAAADLPRIADVLQRLRPVASSVGARTIPGLPGASPVKVDAAFQKATKDLAKIRKPKDLKRAAAIADRLAEIGDVLGADALVSFAYAAAVERGDADGHQAAALWRDHDFGFRIQFKNQHQRRPWSIPAERTGAGIARHVEGSLLALDVAFGPLALRRVSGRPPPRAPTLTDSDRSSLIDTVIFANARDYADDSRQAMIDAIERGRLRIVDARTFADVHAIVADANLNGWRRGVSYWSHSQGAFDGRFLSLAELYRVGSGDVGPEALQQWGVSARATIGCLCLRFPEAGSWEQVAGQLQGGWLPTAVADLVLRVAENLQRHGVPASLTRGVLAAATHDYVQELQRIHPDDWMSMVRHARAIPSDRMADYVASLTSRGPLVAAASGTDLR